MTSTAPTAKRVTAADVARSLGISRATVGFVLNDTPGQTISEATRARVLDEAKRLGYRANTAARALASGRSRIILLVLPDWPLDYAMRTHLDEASLALDEAGYALVTMTPHPGGQAQPLWETLRPDVVMGMTPFTVDQLDSIRRSGVEHIIPPQPTGELSEDDQLGFPKAPACRWSTSSHAEGCAWPSRGPRTRGSPISSPSARLGRMQRFAMPLLARSSLMTR